jgi:hypothetical protein
MNRLTRVSRRPWRVAQAAVRWPVTTQDRARRNALVASTAMAGRRAERAEVEAFLREHDRRGRTA